MHRRVLVKRSGWTRLLVDGVLLWGKRVCRSLLGNHPDPPSMYLPDVMELIHSVDRSNVTAELSQMHSKKFVPRRMLLESGITAKYIQKASLDKGNHKAMAWGSARQPRLVICILPLLSHGNIDSSAAGVYPNRLSVLIPCAIIHGLVIA